MLSSFLDRLGTLSGVEASKHDYAHEHEHDKGSAQTRQVSPLAMTKYTTYPKTKTEIIRDRSRFGKVIGD